MESFNFVQVGSHSPLWWKASCELLEEAAVGVVVLKQKRECWEGRWEQQFWGKSGRQGIGLGNRLYSVELV